MPDTAYKDMTQEQKCTEVAKTASFVESISKYDFTEYMVIHCHGDTTELAKTIDLNMEDEIALGMAKEYYLSSFDHGRALLFVRRI